LGLRLDKLIADNQAQAENNASLFSTLFDIVKAMSAGAGAAGTIYNLTRETPVPRVGGGSIMERFPSQKVVKKKKKKKNVHK